MADLGLVTPRQARVLGVVPILVQTHFTNNYGLLIGLRPPFGRLISGVNI